MWPRGRRGHGSRCVLLAGGGGGVGLAGDGASHWAGSRGRVRCVLQAVVASVQRLFVAPTSILTAFCVGGREGDRERREIGGEAGVPWRGLGAARPWPQRLSWPLATGLACCGPTRGCRHALEPALSAPLLASSPRSTLYHHQTLPRPRLAIHEPPDSPRGFSLLEVVTRPRPSAACHSLAILQTQRPGN